MALTPPGIRTLARYGLTLKDWLNLVQAQGGVCPVCERKLDALKLNIDHEHVYRWRYMEPAERARYVRGILCARCNWRLVHSTMPSAQAQRIADYLRRYEERRDVPAATDKRDDPPIQ